MALTAAIRRRMFGRLLMLQASWNFERMQGLGFAFALQPWLESLYPQPEARARAIARHAEYFNTQPYVASLLAGYVCSLEEAAAALPEAEAAAAFERMRLVKKAMAASLAGLGDTFFWSALRPFAAAAGIAAGLLAFASGRAGAGFWTAGVYLLAYNAPALWLRWRGLALGYEWKEQLPARLKEYAVQAWVRRLRLAGATLALVIFGLVLAAAQPGQRMLGALSVGVFSALYMVFPDRASAPRLYGASCLVGCLAAAAGWL